MSAGGPRRAVEFINPFIRRSSFVMLALNKNSKFYMTTNTGEMAEHIVIPRPNSRLRFSLPGAHGSEEYFRADDPANARACLKKLRLWETTTFARLGGDRNGMYGANSTRFIILGYNVLSPSLLETHRQLYKDCNPKSLEWEYRLELFLEEVDELKADIVCLQEVDAIHFEATYVPRMAEKGFKGVYKKRTREKEDGCAIFWKQSLFNLVERLDVEFHQPHVPLLNRDNIGLLVKLQSTRGRRPKLVVGTTHLLYNPKRTDVKICQIQLLLAEMDRFAFSGFDKKGETIYHPMILTGDFNADPAFSPLVSFIADGLVRTAAARADAFLNHAITEFIPAHAGLGSHEHAGISDQCQHYKIVWERLEKFLLSRKNFFELDLSSHAQLVNLYGDPSNGMNTNPVPSIVSGTLPKAVANKNGFQNVTASAQAELTNTFAQNFDPEEHSRILDNINKSGTQCTFGSGELSHKLRFRNVYAPRLDRTYDNETVATTRQNIWTCVDHMFYSMQWSDLQRRNVEGSLKLLRRLGLLTRNQCKQNGCLPSLAVPSDHFPLVAEFILK